MVRQEGLLFVNAVQSRSVSAIQVHEVKFAAKRFFTLVKGVSGDLEEVAKNSLEEE